MTYIKVEQAHTDDERWIEAGADAFAVHIAALVYCDRQLTEGRISHAMAQRVSLAVPTGRAKAAIAALVKLGFWTLDGDAYQIGQYESHAFPAEQIKRVRTRWANDKRRRQQHNVGDHTQCRDPRFCPAIREGSTVEAGMDSKVESGLTPPLDAHAYTKPNSMRPNETRPEGSGFGLGGESHAAEPSAQREPHQWQDDSSGISCERCRLPKTHQCHSFEAVS